MDPYEPNQPLGGGFKDLLLPLLREMIQFDQYVSNGHGWFEDCSCAWPKDPDLAEGSWMRTVERFIQTHPDV